MKEILDFIVNSQGGVSESQILLHFPSLSRAVLQQKIKKLLEVKEIVGTKDKDPVYSQIVTDHSHERKLISDVLRSEKSLPVQLIRTKTKISQNLLLKILRQMEKENLVQSFKGYKNNAKLYALYGEVPNDSITGGVFFVDGDIDQEFIELLKEVITGYMKKIDIEHFEDNPTAEDIHTFIVESKILATEISLENIIHLIKVMVYEEKIIELNYEEKTLYKLSNA